MSITVFYTIKPNSEASQAEAKLMAKQAASHEALKALLHDYGLVGSPELPEDPSPFRSAKPPFSWRVLYMNNRPYSFGLYGADGIRASDKQHQNWIGSDPVRCNTFTARDGGLSVNHRHPAGKALRKRMDAMPPTVSSGDVTELFVIPRKKDGKKVSRLCMIVTTSRGLYSHGCTMHTSTSHPTIIGVPGPALLRPEWRLAKGLKEIAASKVVKMLNNKEEGEDQ